IGFIKALEPGDTAALIAFNDAPRIIREDTDDKKKLEQAVESIEARGGTAMYDAIAAGVDVLKVHEGHKAIILLSDGRDESSDGIGPGSIATYEEVLDKVLEAETVLYAVGTGAHLEKEFDYYHRHRVGEILGTLAGRSGGRAYLIKKASKLKRAYAKIADELRHQYTLAYYPPRPARPAGKHDRRGRDWHPIEVRVSRPRSRVTARAGYFAR
ncbi:MAG: VWA domain-containing protein, partial [Acidobacteriota bacterium]